MSPNPNIKLGVELEYPVAEPGSDPLADTASGSGDYVDDAQDAHRRGDIPKSDTRHVTYDGTVGIEAVSRPLAPEAAGEWYHRTVDGLTDHVATFAPCSIMGGSTAGTHIHISPLTTEQARTLAEWSQQGWMQVFACSGIVRSQAPDYDVFRGGRYCQLDEGLSTRSGRAGFNRYAVVNQRGSDHYEWRLPEPTLPRHFRHITEFLRLFIAEGATEAQMYAQDVLEDSHEPITAVERVEAIGSEPVVDDQPTVTRTPHFETAGWFNSLKAAESMPYVHRVEMDGDHFYTFRTTLSRGEYEWKGVTFEEQSVLDATTLEPVDPHEASRVRETFRRFRRGALNEATEGQKKLAEVLDAKK